MGYITYVFKNLEDDSFGKKYCMVTRWPNWQCGNIEIGESGYLTYKEIIAGRDYWWNGETQIPYNYSNLVFTKFVNNRIDNSKKDIII